MGLLSDLLKGRSSMLIVMQDYPDPDAIASAAGLRVLANHLSGVQCSLAHGGVVGRAENRALAKYLDLNLRSIDDVDVNRFDLLALVDTQTGTGNNSLPDDIVPDIVIDHHPIGKATRSSPFTDIRSKYGATSTIIYEYLVTASASIDVPLATALLYGIRSDTQDLGRDGTQADIDAFLGLYPSANKRLLSRIQQEPVNDDYFQALSDALGDARVHDNALIAGLGPTGNPDMIGEIADLLLRRENTDWVMCYGFHAGKALFSIRSLATQADAGSVAKKVAGRNGTAGGHNAYAGGQIPLPEGTVNEANEVACEISGRFTRAVGAGEKLTTRLVKRK